MPSTKRALWLIAALALASPAFAQFGSNATKLRGRNICSTTPTDTQVLAWDASSNCWKPATGGGGGGGSGVTYCAPSSASATTYTCTLPTLAAGVAVAFVPDVTGTGGATTLNTKSIKLWDGSTNPSQIQLLAGKLYYLTYDGTVFRLAPNDDCVTGTTSASVLINNAVSQEVTILASGLPGDFLPSEAWVNITTAGTFSSTLTASMGRTGSSTNAEWVPAIDAKTIQAWGDKPTPAVFGVANTYSAIVLNFTGGSALGNGATSNVTTLAVSWGFCGKRSLQ